MTTSLSATEALACFLSAAVILLFYRGSCIRSSSRLPLPPGPRPLPLIGNLLDLPTEKQWLAYERWGMTYGDIISLDAFGTRIVVLNSFEAATELLERRSTIYSSRKPKFMLNDLMNFASWNWGLLEYGDAWRRGRRLFHARTHAGKVPEYRALQLRSARAFVRNVLRDYSDIAGTVRSSFASTAMDISYGIEVTGKDDPYVRIADAVIAYFDKAVLPGGYLIDFFPLLRYVPVWCPGAGFWRDAEEARMLSLEMREAPIRAVKAAMAKGEALPSIASTMLAEISAGKMTQQDHEDVRDLTGIVYQAGADTTVSTVTSYFLALLHSPAAQDRAQAELDAVVGPDRLPDFTDWPRLPYANAIALELLRWLPVNPIGIPHATTKEDEYRGFRIPKGAVIIGNAWAMLHDEKAYPDPLKFNPERFLIRLDDGGWVLDESALDPRRIAFGFGRRICPGRHLALDSLAAAVMTLLACVRVAPALDEAGVPIRPPVETHGAFLAHPVPFSCVVKVRSEMARRLLGGPLPERVFG